MKKTFKTDVVFLIQSLKESDEETGRRVQAALVKKGILDADKSLFFRVFDENDFKGALWWILDSLKEKKFKYPCIQIDCHGSDDGLHLRSNDVISWSRVEDFLNQILNQTENNLLVVLGACHGGYLLNKENIKYLPCSVLVASTHAVHGDSLDDRLCRFYSSLFASGRISEALSALNGLEYNNDGKFSVDVTNRNQSPNPLKVTTPTAPR